MGYKLGVSLGYGIVFLAYGVILFLLTGFAASGAWLGLVCTVVVLSLCLLVVWKDVFRIEIAQLRMTLSVVLTAFFVLQLVVGAVVCGLPIRWGIALETVLLAICLLCSGGILLGGRMIAEREREALIKRGAACSVDESEDIR